MHGQKPTRANSGKRIVPQVFLRRIWKFRRKDIVFRYDPTPQRVVSTSYRILRFGLYSCAKLSLSLLNQSTVLSWSTYLTIYWNRAPFCCFPSRHFDIMKRARCHDDMGHACRGINYLFVNGVAPAILFIAINTFAFSRWGVGFVMAIPDGRLVRPVEMEWCFFTFVRRIGHLTYCLPTCKVNRYSPI